MAVPTYNQLMRPVLEAVSSGEAFQRAQLKEEVIRALPSEQADTRATTPTGIPLLEKRIEWAVHYLFKAGLLTRPQRGYYQITDRGRDVSKSGPVVLDKLFLQKFPEFAEWLERSSGIERSDDRTPPETVTLSDEDQSLTPDDLVSQGIAAIKNQAVEDLLDQLMQVTPTQFERLVTRVIGELGYVGTGGYGETTQPSGDGGIDGIIHRDRLGLERILLQAKKWAPDRNVGREEIDKFLGVLGRENASLGVFITTSSFSTGARDGVKHLGGQVALIDGRELANLMYEYGVGVSTDATFVTKRLDTDFFENL